MEVYKSVLKYCDNPIRLGAMNTVNAGLACEGLSLLSPLLYLHNMVSITESTSMFTLADFEVHTRDGPDKNTWNFYSSGADNEHTLRDNVDMGCR